MKPIPLTPVTGGVLLPKNVVCRNELITTYWKILNVKSISLFAERRFGKSSVIRKMDAQNPRGFISIYKSVQAVGNSEDLVELLYIYAKEHKMVQGSILQVLEGAWNKLAEVVPEINGVKLDKINHVWQKKLIYLIENILKSNPKEILVIFLDEFSLMLDRMDYGDAATIIGFLRDIVHDHFSSKLRFVYTGSIGVDLIIQKIEKAGYNLGDPLNHTERKRLPPFTLGQTNFFCQCLELGCEISLSKEVRKHIYFITDGIPYFIDRIYSSIRYNESLTIESIDNALYEVINDQDDKNNLEHFYDRIKDHYPDPDMSYDLLSILCNSDQLTEDEIIEEVLRSKNKSKRNIREELNRLWRDGYLARTIKDEKRIFSFNYNIIRKWWKINKA